MIIFINNKSGPTKFCQITLRIKRFVHKRKVVPFFCLAVYNCAVCVFDAAGNSESVWNDLPGAEHSRMLN